MKPNLSKNPKISCFLNFLQTSNNVCVFKTFRELDYLETLKKELAMQFAF